MTAIVDTNTNEFMPLGHAVDARYVSVIVPRNPEPAIEKYSGNPASPFMAKTAQEISDYATTVMTTAATASSRQKDTLADIAWAIRFSNVLVWDAKTTAQKKAQVLAEADIWRDLRVFIEKNV